MAPLERTPNLYLKEGLMFYSHCKRQNAGSILQSVHLVPLVYSVGWIYIFLTKHGIWALVPNSKVLVNQLC